MALAAMLRGVARGRARAARRTAGEDQREPRSPRRADDRLGRVAVNRNDLCQMQIGSAHVPLLDDRDRWHIVAFLRELAHQLGGKREEWGQAISVLGLARSTPRPTKTT